MLSVLHITPWFPDTKNITDGIFIARHVESLEEFCRNQVLHLKFGTKSITAPATTRFQNIEIERAVLKPLMNRWRIKEYQASRFVQKYLKKHHKSFDLVNFHIAYPNGIGISALKKNFPTLRFVITEHWSAYHENFGLQEKSIGLKRIAQIFENNIPLLVVSKALGEDIRKFANVPNMPYKVVPNIVDSRFIYEDKQKTDPIVLSSINNWSRLKNPSVIIDAFSLLLQSVKNAKLIIGGSGELISEMVSLVAKLGIEEHVKLMGKLTETEVLELLKKSHVYCQPAHYETFSVICAEALSAGIPVVASNVGGVRDFIDKTNGILVEEANAELWCRKMKFVLKNLDSYNNQVFSERIRFKFSKKTVGKVYYKHLYKIASDSNAL